MHHLRDAGGKAKLRVFNFKTTPINLELGEPKLSYMYLVSQLGHRYLRQSKKDTSIAPCMKKNRATLSQAYTP